MKVGRLTLARVFWRSLFLQAAWNPRGMQNLGFAWAMAPALDELYPDGQKRAAAAARHLEFFNSHPYAAAAILGGAVALEERVAEGSAKGEDVSVFKRALGPPFAALGDGFFWLALRPATALAATMTVRYLGLWSLLVFLGLYNGAHAVARTWLFVQGYRLGEGIVARVSEARVPRGTGLLKGAASVLAGAMAMGAVLTAGVPGRFWHALFTALAVLAFAWLLPRLGLLRSIYLALLMGVAIGGTIL